MAEEKKEEMLEEEEQEGTQEDNGVEDKSAPGEDKPVPKTFTQEQVNRMMAKEKNQGKSSVFRELGIDPKDTKMVGMFKTFIESQKSEDDKARDKASEEAEKVAEANQRVMVAEAKAEAMLMGAKTQYVEDVVALAVAKSSDGTDLKTLIGEFKTKYPIWFGKEDKEDGSEEEDKPGKKGTGKSVKTKSKKEEGKEKGLGARLAAQRKSSINKSSYWGKK